MKFYDTNAILKLQDKIFEEDFIISSVTLQELEHIKVSRNKDDQVKYEARKALHLLDDNSDKYDVVVYDNAIENYILGKNMEITPDTKIVGSCAFINAMKDVVFITDDIACKMIARKIFNLTVKGVNDEPVDDYSGFVEKTLSESEMAYFYEHLQENIYGLLENEYLILKDSNNHVVDTLVWREGMYQNIKFPNIKSDYFGAVKPLNGDIYQQMALNSFSNNQITTCPINEAEGVMSSDGEYFWHVDVFPSIKKQDVDTVSLVEIDVYEYNKLRALNMKTPQEIIDAYTLDLITGGVL